MERPPEEELDVIIRPGDPRFALEREAWTAAVRKAHSLHSADELLAGVADHNWHVRYESIDRLKARWHDDDRTFPALAKLAERDPKWHVRGKALTALLDFNRDEVTSIAERAMQDPSSHVRWDANFVLYQLGLTKSIPPRLPRLAESFPTESETPRVCVVCPTDAHAIADPEALG